MVGYRAKVIEIWTLWVSILRFHVLFTVKCSKSFCAFAIFGNLVSYL